MPVGFLSQAKTDTESVDTSGRCRFYVKAAGEWTGAAPEENSEIANGSTTPQQKLSNGHAAPTPATPVNTGVSLAKVDPTWNATEVKSYKPHVEDGSWYLSEIDVEWIAAGCYILGCGGGGNPSHIFLALRKLIREGTSIRVIDLSSLDPNQLCIWGGGIGSPEVSSERLMGEEYNESVQELLDFMHVCPTYRPDQLGLI